jgi:hypothetical protein
MKNILLQQRTINLAFVVAAVLVAVCTADASPQPENLLLSAGFKAKVAQTAPQRQELKTLAKGKVSPVTQSGKTFYVYPDARGNRLYVGTAAQYQAYQNLVTKARGSARPITNEEYIGGNPVRVREFHGWGPLGE